MSANEKVDFKQKMAEMYESSADDGQHPPPSLTPIWLTSLTSRNCFIVLFLSILRALIDLCMHQLQWPHIAKNVSISQHLKRGLVLATEGGLHQTETNIPSWQCVEANGAGGKRPTMGSGRTRVWFGRGPITYPTCKPFSSWKLIETGGTIQAST